MKSILKITSVFAASLLCIPAMVLTSDIPAPVSGTENITQTKTENASENKSPEPEEKRESFSVLDTESGQVSDISVRDYIIGAVCAEMPASFEPEALKAQAVVSHTYALYQAENSKNDDTLCGADFSDDPSKYQAFFTDAEIHRYYGDKYDEYYTRISAAVDEVFDEILVYNNEPIVAAFHSMSSGKTESAENIWGTKLDYLVPCDSSSDTEAPGYSEECIFTSDEIRSRITAAYEDAEFPSDRRKWFSITQKSDSGTVLEMKAGNISLSGTEFRDIMSVRSAAFDISYDGDNRFRIITEGYGHGVGMSQYGANHMASEGKNYVQILEHYYKGAVLKTV